MVQDIHNPEVANGISEVEKPDGRRYSRRGGRPGLDVDINAVCDAVLGVWNGSGETITEIAERFGVSRGWIWKWVYPQIDCRRHSLTNGKKH